MQLQMKLVANQPEDIQEIVKPVIQRNGHFADPSVLLCSMLEHPDASVRKQAVDIIHKTRAKTVTKASNSKEPDS